MKNVAKKIEGLETQMKNMIDSEVKTIQSFKTETKEQV